MSVDVDVVVIGGGPVGTTALGLLGRAGLTAVGVERHTEPWPTARAVHFDGETMRTLQGLGIAERFREVVIPMKDVAVLNEADELLAHAPTDRLGDQGWNDHISFHQPDVERLLQEVVDQAEGVRLRHGVTATKVQTVADGVEVSTLDSDGREGLIRARWAIAADGGRSEIRRALGIETDKYGEDTQWLVVDGQLTDAPGYDADMIQFARYSRPALWLRLPGDRVRMEFMIVPGDDPDQIATPEAVERISRGALPVDKFTPERLALYTFRGRIARQWRHGNIFLAGDAAHQAPPLFGQGLCAGIRDVANLVWKLDLVARGKADDTLLDTYETERRPHATFWVETAANQAVVMETLDPKIAEGRDQFIRDHPDASTVPTPPPLGPGLHNNNDHDEHAGTLGIQPLLDDGTRLDDTTGPRFLITTRPAIYNALPEEARTALDTDDHTTVLTHGPAVDQILRAADAEFVITRPDHYILGTGNTTTDLEHLAQLIPTIARTTTPSKA